MIINLSYFNGEIFIPNTHKTDVSEPLTQLIIKLEPKLLRDVLGYDLAKAFSDGLAEVTVEQKWKDLLNGVDYTNRSGRLSTWMGFKGFFGIPDDSYTAGTVYQSMIANYVYYHWIKKEFTQTVGLGEVRTKAENAEKAIPEAKLVRAWNEMIDWIKELIDFLDTKREDYPQWDKQDRYTLRRNYWYTNVLGI